MIKSYTNIFYLSHMKAGRLVSSEPLNLKLNESLDAIQEHGGNIINSSFTAEGGNVYVYHIVYEDNGNFEEINSYLRDVVFNFSEIKINELKSS